MFFPIHSLQASSLEALPSPRVLVSQMNTLSQAGNHEKKGGEKNMFKKQATGGIDYFYLHSTGQTLSVKI